MHPGDVVPLATRAEALFVSSVQESEHPDAERICGAVDDTLRRYRVDGVAALVAQEAGDHPEGYLRRMRWALGAVQLTIESGAEPDQPDRDGYPGECRYSR